MVEFTRLAYVPMGRTVFIAAAKIVESRPNVTARDLFRPFFDASGLPADAVRQLAKCSSVGPADHYHGVMARGS
jgi:hypothetical protein